MKIVYDTGHDAFRAVASYDEKDVLKNAGFRWDPNRRYWWTSDATKAEKLRRFADASAKERLAELAEHREKSLVGSRSASADVDIPAPPGLEYLPFQKAGIAYALDRKDTLIADQMGLGKTIQAIGFVNAINVASVCVVCPASLKINWERELGKWLVRNLSIAVVESRKLWPDDADVVIVNYDIIHKFLELKQRMWDVLIVDESHALKNPRAKRTREVLGYGKRGEEIAPIQAKRRLFLTGTPVLNRPIELWPLLHAVDPGRWGTWVNFVTRYCAAEKTRFGWDVSGASFTAELQRRLRESIMVRRLKSEVLTELPPKRRQTLILPNDQVRRLIAKEKKQHDTHSERIALLREAANHAVDDCDPAAYQKHLVSLRTAMMTDFAELSAVRRELAEAKVPYVLEHLDATDGKVVVFAHHRSVIGKLAAELGDSAVSLTGEDTVEARQRAVDRFQSDPKVRFFIGSIQAAGIGITLTAASHVVFAELDWVPAAISQAEDRVHRIGQTESVLVQHLVFDGSLDARLIHTLLEKQRVIDETLDRKDRT